MNKPVGPSLNICEAFLTMRIPALFLLIVICGCSSNSRSGPPSVSETSAAHSELADRIAFLQEYVQFKRSYQKLEYAVNYQNNGGGMVPGPSDWDIRILAVVPPNEISKWLPKTEKSTRQTLPTWLDQVPGEIATAGITEWYASGTTEIGIDRSTSTIAYRNTTMP